MDFNVQEPVPSFQGLSAGSLQLFCQAYSDKPVIPAQPDLVANLDLVMHRLGAWFPTDWRVFCREMAEGMTPAIDSLHQ